MSRGHEQFLRVLSRAVLLSAVLAAACDSPDTSRHPVLGNWVWVGEHGVDLAEIKFFPDGKCRFTYEGRKMLFCGWDPLAEKARFKIRFGPVPIMRATGTVAGEKVSLAFASWGSGTSLKLVRVGSQREKSIRAYMRGRDLFHAGEIEKTFVEWTTAAQCGDALYQKHLAWLLATGKDPKLHDGKKAIAYAEKAVAQERSARYLDTLAAALARDGQFERAVQVQQEALSLATKESASFDGDTESVKEYAERLALYKAGQAYTQG